MVTCIFAFLTYSKRLDTRRSYIWLFLEKWKESKKRNNKTDIPSVPFRWLLVYNNCKWNTYNLEIFLVINSELERLLTTPFLFYFLIFFLTAFITLFLAFYFPDCRIGKSTKAKKKFIFVKCAIFLSFFPPLRPSHHKLKSKIYPDHHILCRL